MTPIPDDVIEAGARAIRISGGMPADDWEQIPEWVKGKWREVSRACLTAALQQAEAKHGAVLAKVPGEVRNLFGPKEERTRAEGWNAAIAVSRAGRMGDKG